MASFNKIILLGNLTRDPELKYTPKGSAIADIGLAVNRTYTTDGGEKREEVTFVDVTLWGRVAEIVGEYCKTLDDPQPGDKSTRRLDTGALVKVEPMTEHEKQANLFDMEEGSDATVTITVGDNTATAPLEQFTKLAKKVVEASK